MYNKFLKFITIEFNEHFRNPYSSEGKIYRNLLTILTNINKLTRN